MFLHKQIIAFRPDKSDLIFAIKTYIAAMLSLFIAFYLNLSYPMWAIGTVYIIVTPFSGTVSSKAVFRLIGTLLGGAVAVLLLPKLINTPLSFTFVLALWVGFSLYISLLDRSPRSYIFTICGFTTVMVVATSINSIDTVSVFDTALNRILETSIAVVCVALIFSILFPKHIGPVIKLRVDNTLKDSKELFTQIMHNQINQENSQTLINKLTKDVSELHVLAEHLGYEKSKFSGMTKPVQEILNQVTMLLANTTTISERFKEMDHYDLAYRSALSSLHDQVLNYLSQLHSDHQINLHTINQAFKIEYKNIESLLRAEQRIMFEGVKMDIRHLIQNVFYIREIWASILDGKKKLPKNIISPLTYYPILHRDSGFAVRSGLAAALAIIISCFIWIFSGWKYGFMMLQITGVSACILAAIDNPVPALKMFVRGAFYSSILALVYVLFILPSVKEFWQLALVLAPPLIYLVTMYAHPPLNGLAMPITVSFAMSLNLQNNYNIDMVTLIDTCLACIAGPIISAFSIYLIRSFTPEQSVKRILSQHYKSMYSSIYIPYGVQFRIHLRKMLDRIGILNSKAIPSIELRKKANEILIESCTTIDLSRLNDLQKRFQLSQKLKSRIWLLQSILDKTFRKLEKQLSIDLNDKNELIYSIQKLEKEAMLEDNIEIKNRILISTHNIRHGIIENL
nr:FUSC family protein [Acinetobacter sp. Marseille-Q1620]